jgi:actin related protein 2/3 complex, subunit 2
MLVAPFEDADVTVVVDRRALVAPAAEVITKVACLRKSVVAFPFHRMLRAVAAGTGGSEKPFVIRTVPEEPIYLLPRVDRVIVIFHLAFSEPTDRAIARVVAQELTEANRQVNNAPPCSWSERDAPLELKGFAGVPRPSADERSIGFMSFSLFPTSLKTDAQREAAASHFALFRTFLAYHIKAAKAYLHARMRQRAEGLQKVLNRAIPEDPFADKGMKLASGKTFVRK